MCGTIFVNKMLSLTSILEKTDINMIILILVV